MTTEVEKITTEEAGKLAKKLYSKLCEAATGGRAPIAGKKVEDARHIAYKLVRRYFDTSFGE